MGEVGVISYHWTSGVLGVVIAGTILLLVRRDYLHTRYAVWWLLTAAVVLVLGVFPQIIDYIAETVGVHYPPVLLMVVCVGLILIKILTMDLERSRQKEELRRLTQRLALLEGSREPAASNNRSIEFREPGRGPRPPEADKVEADPERGERAASYRIARRNR